MFNRLKYRLHSAYKRPMRIIFIMMLCAATAVTGIVFSRSVRTISISDGENRYLVRSVSGDVKSAIRLAGISTDAYRIVTLNKSFSGATVEIEYIFPVFITRGEQTIKLEATRGTVKEILEMAGFSVDKYDIIEPAADKVIKDTAYIDFTDIDYVSGSYEESINPSTEVVYNDEAPLGSETVIAGKAGRQTVNYTEKLVNGVSVEKTVNGTSIITAAVNNKRVVGTRPGTAVTTSAAVKTISQLTPQSPIELDANGRPVNYLSKKTVQATAYTYTGNNCATGVAPKPGYIAVNPKIIPYGTKMYIVSSDGRYVYGYAIAADTGGFINSRPNNVDLFLSTQSACIAFGRRNVEIYFLP